VDEVTALPVSIKYGRCRSRKPTGWRQLIPGSVYATMRSGSQKR